MQRSPRRGDIFWLAPQASSGSELASGSAHPHVVVSEDVFNQSRVHTLIVCALTSNLKRSSEPGNVLLDIGEGDLPKQSVAVVSQLSSVPKSSLGEYVGSLAQSRVEQILDGQRFQQASFFVGR
jgi:mRNA interferase MazF